MFSGGGRAGRCIHESAGLRIDIISVMPLPAARSKKSVSSSVATNELDGAGTWMRIPGRVLSHSQFDAYPRFVYLTVTIIAWSNCGEFGS